MNTQIPQKKLEEVILISSIKRNRNWCFTLNNYKENDITHLNVEKENKNCKQFCFQEEMGENKIPHLQGVISYKDGRSFNVMRKLLPRAHWEICRNLKASLSYCSKEATRAGKIYTHNYKPIKQLTQTEFEYWLAFELPKLRAKLHE